MTLIKLDSLAYNSCKNVICRRQFFNIAKDYDEVASKKRQEV